MGAPQLPPKAQGQALKRLLEARRVQMNHEIDSKVEQLVAQLDAAAGLKQAEFDERRKQEQAQAKAEGQQPQPSDFNQHTADPQRVASQGAPDGGIQLSLAGVRGGQTANQANVPARQALGTAPVAQGGQDASVTVGGQTFSAPAQRRSQVTETGPQQVAPGMFLPVSQTRETVEDNVLTPGQVLQAQIQQTQLAEENRRANIKLNQSIAIDLANEGLPGSVVGAALSGDSQALVAALEKAGPTLSQQVKEAQIRASNASADRDISAALLNEAQISTLVGEWAGRSLATNAGFPTPSGADLLTDNQIVQRIDDMVDENGALRPGQEAGIYNLTANTLHRHGTVPVFQTKGNFVSEIFSGPKKTGMVSAKQAAEALQILTNPNAPEEARREAAKFLDESSLFEVNLKSGTISTREPNQVAANAVRNLAQKVDFTGGAYQVPPATRPQPGPEPAPAPAKRSLEERLAERRQRQEAFKRHFRGTAPTQPQR